MAIIRIAKLSNWEEVWREMHAEAEFNWTKTRPIMGLALTKDEVVAIRTRAFKEKRSVQSVATELVRLGMQTRA